MFVYIGSEKESEVDKLRSILAQLDYTYEIKQCDRKGVPFSLFMYVPEIHPETGQPFLEREDEAHVFKVAYLIRFDMLLIECRHYSHV